jgi:hypothetical protein
MRTMTDSHSALRVFESKRKPCAAGANVRKLANNTYLEWFDDELLALRLHQTRIAWYTPEYVKLTLEGWRTMTTWGRVTEFTPARTFGSAGLFYVVDNGAGSGVLFEEGIKVAPDGSVLNPMLPSTQSAIERAVHGTSRKLTPWLRKCVRAWDDTWDDDELVCPDCAKWRTIANNEGYLEHVVEAHFPHEPVLFEDLNSWLGFAPNVRGDAFVAAAVASLRHSLRDRLIEIELRRVAPDFPWIPPTRRRGYEPLWPTLHA